MQHPTNPQDGPPVKTLHAAKLLIRELQQRMGLLRTSGNVPPETSAPIPKAAAALHPQLREPNQLAKPEVNLAAMSPRQLKELFANSTVSDLRKLLAAETGRDRKHQDPSVIASLYRELKGRR